MKRFSKFVSVLLIAVSVLTAVQYIEVVNNKSAKQDTLAPFIMLKGSKDIVLRKGQTYVEDGFIAVDDVDGFITKNVVRREYDGKIYYSVTDKSGKTSTVTRKVTYAAPLFELNDQDIILLTLHREFTDPGVILAPYLEQYRDRVQVLTDLNIDLEGVYNVFYILDVAGEHHVVHRFVDVLDIGPQAVPMPTVDPDYCPFADDAPLCDDPLPDEEYDDDEIHAEKFEAKMQNAPVSKA